MLISFYTESEYQMGSESYEIIAELFYDPRNIEVLCSIYENEISLGAIVKVLGITESEVTERLVSLCKRHLVNCREEADGTVYSLANPKVCDSILSLRDSIECNGSR